jgi:RNA polymerase sigma-70 factor (ECF subfamily)
MQPTGLCPGPGEIEQWLEAARRGSSEALGRVLELCRPYLLQVANDQLADDLQAKLGASDLVQDTFLEAQRDFGGFQSCSEEELRAWLRRILLNNLANLNRHYRHTDKRQLEREVSLPDAAGGELSRPLADPGPSPSSQAGARERDQRLEQALARLPESQRQVIRLRNYERLSFEAAGARMGRSAEAARKLWGRAIDQLQRILDPADEP